MHRVQGQPPLSAAADKEEEATGAVRAKNWAEPQAEPQAEKRGAGASGSSRRARD